MVAPRRLAGSLLTAGKHALLRAAALTGVEGLLRDSKWRQNRLLILCYHGLSLGDEHLWSSLYVTDQHFAARLALLRASGYNVLPLDAAIRGLYDGTLPPRSVAVTFDDGFADFYIKGQPILRASGVPATVYLTTYYAADQRAVFDPLLAYLFWKGQGRTVRVPGPQGGMLEIPRDEGKRRELHALVLAHARSARWSAEEKDEFATEVSRQIAFDIDALREKRIFNVMSADELADLDPDLVDIQLHTHRHRTPRDRDSFVREVTDNRHAIRELLPHRPDPMHFCYPSGDYDLVFLPWLRDNGIISATTCDVGMASPSLDPLLLPRLLDSMHIPTFVFRSWLAGVGSFLPQRPA